MRGLLVATLVLALIGCQSAGKSPTSTPSTSATVAVAAPTSRSTLATSATTGPPQTSGLRTVLSPVGLNVRAEALKTATILGTAAPGSTLTVLSHTDKADGGWYQVKGATVTGWIIDNPKLSAPGRFKAYSSDQHQFAALFPDGWNPTEAGPASVVFRPPSGTDAIVATTAATPALLGRGRAGYRQSADEQVVVCGVTGDLVTFIQTSAVAAPGSTNPPPGGAAPGHLLVQVHLTLDAQHALAIDGNLADLNQVQTVRDFIDSLTFPFPQCEQGATPTSTSVP